MTDDNNGNPPDDPQDEPTPGEGISTSSTPHSSSDESSDDSLDASSEKTAEISQPLHQPEATQTVPSSEPAKADWKTQLRGHFEKIRDTKWAKVFAERVQNFEPIQAAEWANRTFQRQDAGFYGKALTIGLCTWFVADLLALLAGKYVPEPPVARLSSIGRVHRVKTIDDYNIVFTRNLFSSAGVIPGEEGPGAPIDTGGAPVRTSLPLNLIGTLILRDELRSIATIEDKSATMVYPVRVQDEIPSKAKIIKIEPRKVTFINTSNGRREFVDIPEDAVPANNPRIAVGTGAGKGPGIEKISESQFNISRTEVDKTLSDLNNVLTQARAVPNFENGVPNGYKLFQIVPGSIYDKLGLQNGDVIAGINGQSINDPGQAFQMLNEFKTQSHIELQVKKDGKLKTNSYDIR